MDVNAAAGFFAAVCGGPISDCREPRAAGFAEGTIEVRRETRDELPMLGRERVAPAAAGLAVPFALDGVLVLELVLLGGPLAMAGLEGALVGD